MGKKRANGSGTIYRHGRRWRAQWCYTVNGKAVRGSKIFDTAKSAKEYLDEMARKMSSGEVTSGTLGDWMTSWLEVHKANTRASTYYTDWKAIDRHVRPYLDKVPLMDISSAKINSWLAKLKVDGRSDDQREKAWKALRKCLLDHDSIPKSRIEKVKAPTVRRKERNALTWEELRRLFVTASTWEERHPYLEAMLRVWVECCCRPSEILALRRSDYKDGVVSIRQAMDRFSHQPENLKTEKSRRDIPLTESTRVVLERWLAKSGGDPEKPMFRNKAGGYFQTVDWSARVFRPLVEAAGVRATPHEMRHTGASLLASAGVSIIAIARRMGHTTAALILKTYAHCLPKDQEKLTDVFEKSMPNSKE